MSNISCVVPSYKNPKCLEIVIKSFLDTSNNDNELVCVIDGFSDMYQELFDKYKEHEYIKFLVNPQNRNMPYSINIGVYTALNEYILVINDDNVFPKAWDIVLSKLSNENHVISPNQIERTGPSIFNFEIHDFGDPDNFRYTEFLEQEPSYRKDEVTQDGELFPFYMSKKKFMASGGFDLIYPSPFVCDWDFFLKLELLGLEFYRARNINFYHFGSIATKHSEDSASFHESEEVSSKIFHAKWGFQPCMEWLGHDRPRNSHKPQNTSVVRGVNFD